MLLGYIKIINMKKIDVLYMGKCIGERMFRG